MSAGSSPAVRTSPTAGLARSAGWLALLLAGCDARSDRGTVVVSAIGARPHLADGPADRRDLPSRLLVDATAQGLVRFDAAGQIEPGLAERWIVIDDGASYIFRLREAMWSDGAPVTAEEVVRLLRRRLAATDNPLAPFLTAIDEIVVMTPQVIEIRLKRPRPDLLKLFAQPDMALLRPAPAIGSGPFRLSDSRATAPLLRPAFDPGIADPDDQREHRPEQDVRLIGERAARAILRFARGRADLVGGGTVADWPLLATANVSSAAIRLDPAAGLFGFAVVDRTGFLADPANRAAISQAIDRDALVAAIAPGWEAVDRLLPDPLDSAAPPQVPEWSLLTLDQRRENARAQIARWPMPVHLRLALPQGPGSTLLFAQVAASLLTIGITAERVGEDALADLRLVDRVAPYDSARWYLATACAPCSPEATSALQAARDAGTMAERAARIAQADAALNADTAFVPLARPLRWSLVAPRLAAWQANPRAWHPLNRLRPDPT